MGFSFPRGHSRSELQGSVPLYGLPHVLLPGRTLIYGTGCLLVGISVGLSSLLPEQGCMSGLLAASVPIP